MAEDDQCNVLQNVQIWMTSRSCPKELIRSALSKYCMHGWQTLSHELRLSNDSDLRLLKKSLNDLSSVTWRRLLQKPFKIAASEQYPHVTPAPATILCSCSLPWTRAILLSNWHSNFVCWHLCAHDSDYSFSVSWSWFGDCRDRDILFVTCQWKF